MTTAARSIEIAASPDTVWDALADYGAISTWAPSVDHSSLMTGQVTGVGAVRRIQSGRFVLVEEVVRWEPPTLLSYTLDGVPAVRSVTTTWRVEPSGDGAHVTVTTDVVARPPVAALVARRLGKAGDSLLAGLKEHVE